MILLLLGLACAPKSADPDTLSAIVEAGAARRREMAGVVADGQFSDARYGFTIDVLEGWVPHAGPSAGAMRVALNHVATGTRVEVWVFADGGLEPRRREDCIWTYVDDGEFRSLAVTGTVRVATCVPVDPVGARVFATLVAVDSGVVQVEIHAPVHALAAGKRAGDDVVSTLRW